MTEIISPQKLDKEGKSAFQRGDYPAAAQAFEAACQAYTAAGDRLNAAEMANNSSVAYLQSGDGEAALRAVEGTEAIFAEAGDLRRQGMAAGNRAAALEALDRLDEALHVYELSADLLEQAGEDQLRAHVMQSLSALQLRTGRRLQALASMQAGLEGVQKPSARQRLLKRLLNIPFDFLNKKK
jgi:tetratricopeptide (TPR) repeat protein